MCNARPGGGAGVCRTASGGEGSFTSEFTDHLGCAAACESSSTCLAYEFSTGRRVCELHTDEMTTVELMNDHICCMAGNVVHICTRRRCDFMFLGGFLACRPDTRLAQTPCIGMPSLLLSPPPSVAHPLPRATYATTQPALNDIFVHQVDATAGAKAWGRGVVGWADGPQCEIDCPLASDLNST